jgi:hypothetical protein
VCKDYILSIEDVVDLGRTAPLVGEESSLEICRPFGAEQVL